MSLGATIAALRESVSVQASDIDGAFAEIMDGAAAHEDIKQFLTLTMPLMGHAPLIAAALGDSVPLQVAAGGLDHRRTTSHERRQHERREDQRWKQRCNEDLVAKA